jgi:hypothetical protein
MLEPEDPPHPASSESAPKAATALRYPGVLMRKLTIAFIVSLALLAAAPAQAAIPDLYSGSWPAKLMPDNVELGTIKWVSVTEEWGRGVLDQPWGGAPFTNCPSKGQTRFFLGHYGTGGRLIACTVGKDGKQLHGRYDGSGGEFRPGSFDVSIVTDPSDEEQEFEGVYVEDGGITTDWCGELISSTRPDFEAPSVRALRSFGRSGQPVRLRFAASDDRNIVRVRLTIKHHGKVVGSVATALRRMNGAPSSALWRPRKRLRGTFVVVARAWDRYGNASARSLSTLRLK